jgi:hypothetical protein
MNATAAQPLTFKRVPTPESGWTKYASACGRYVIVGRGTTVPAYRGGAVSAREFVVERDGRRISAFAHSKLGDARLSAQRDAEMLERAQNDARMCERARAAGDPRWADAADGMIYEALAEDTRRDTIALVVADVATVAAAAVTDDIAPGAELSICRHDRRPIGRRRAGNGNWHHVDGRGGRGCADTDTEAEPIDPADEADRVAAIVREEMPRATADDVYTETLARLRRDGITVRPLDDDAPADVQAVGPMVVTASGARKIAATAARNAVRRHARDLGVSEADAEADLRRRAAALDPAPAPPARPTGADAIAAVAHIARRIDADALSDADLMVLGLLANRLGRALDALANRRSSTALHARAANGDNAQLIAAHRHDVDQAAAKYDAARLLLAEALVEYAPQTGAPSPALIAEGRADVAAEDLWGRALEMHAQLGDPAVTVQQLADYLAAGGTESAWQVDAADLR